MCVCMYVCMHVCRYVLRILHEITIVARYSSNMVSGLCHGIYSSNIVFGL